MCGNPRERFQEMLGKSPEEAKFYWSGGPIEVAPRTWFASMFSGTTAFETDDGLVLVDTGMKRLSHGLAAMLRQRSEAPVHTAIYTHGHVDHAYGLEAFLLEQQAVPRIIGHRNMPARFERYEQTARHNSALNARQFGGSVADADQDGAYDTFHQPTMPPTVLYDDAMDIRVGGVRFELHHCKGETDDHTWVFCPDRGVLCPGDLFIWGVPNAGNPQKAQRYPWDWARGLRQMAACEAAAMCPGHGGPVVDDAATVKRMLVETADFLDCVVERTIALLEDGSPPHIDIVSRIEIPSSTSPWLQPIYDEAEFIVRNVIRYYGGWFSGRPSELKPAPRGQLAGELTALAGGVAAMLERATALAEQGDLRLACHLADYALEAATDDAATQLAVAAIYQQRAKGETSLMAVNLYRSAAAYARDGRPFS
jgi:alkyl sulfatase BDS1-like metallo-beta-lactamase superfamily hydrolase